MTKMVKHVSFIITKIIYEVLVVSYIHKESSDTHWNSHLLMSVYIMISDSSLYHNGYFFLIKFISFVGSNYSTIDYMIYITFFFKLNVFCFIPHLMCKIEIIYKVKFSWGDEFYSEQKLSYHAL